MRNTPKNLNALSPILTGISGEYFVAAELSRRGYVASITLRNTKSLDILVANADASKLAGISVKTNRSDKKEWMLNAKAEESYTDSFFYIFVNLIGSSENPSFHIVPSKDVASSIRRSHRDWLNRPNRQGGAHKNQPIRIFRDSNSKYVDRWGLLGLD